MTATWGEVRPLDDPVERDEAIWRSDYEVDSDRVLYSPEFRRLAGVTQVISPQDDYVFHDRLTHSLKVAQVAERLAQELTHTYAGSSDSLPLDQRVCYVAGLAHDIGHPPFGHAAEVELQKKLAEHSGKELLQDSFEGNAQSFRIATKLSFRKGEGTRDDGLNLTWRVLGAISKYPWLRHQQPTGQPKVKNKWGFYETERQYHDRLLELGLIAPYGLEHVQRQNLEAQVMDWADDIAYAVHDLEDFFRAGRVPLDRLSLTAAQPGNKEWRGLVEYAEGKQAELRDADLGVAADQFDSITTGVRDALPDVPFSGSREAHASLLLFSSTMIRVLSTHCVVVDDPASGQPILDVDAFGRSTAEFLKSFTQYFVINDPTVETMQIGQRRVISELFDLLLAMCVKHYVNSNDKPEMKRPLPPRLAEYCIVALADDSFGTYGNDQSRLARAVIDFMCSLTDKQAALLHQRMTGDAVGRLSSYWLNG